MVTLRSGKVTNAKQQIVTGDGSSIMTLTAKRNEMTLRFLDQADDWYYFMEHFIEGPGYFPCVADPDDKSTCPGCSKGHTPSKRYVVNSLYENKPILFKMPATLAERLVTRYERYGKEMRDRFYTVIRTGSGKNDTKYDVENSPDSMGTNGLEKYKNKSKDQIDKIVLADFFKAFPDWRNEEAQPEDPPF